MFSMIITGLNVGDFATIRMLPLPKLKNYHTAPLI